MHTYGDEGDIVDVQRLPEDGDVHPDPLVVIEEVGHLDALIEQVEDGGDAMLTIDHAPASR
jgi:hypothetical protein